MGEVKSGDLVYLLAGGGTTEAKLRGLCMSTIYTQPVSLYGEALICDANLLMEPLIVRGRRLQNRYANLKDGTVVTSDMYIALESTQSPPGIGTILYLAAGPGEDASVRDIISSGDMPMPDSVTSSNIAMPESALRSPVFFGGTWRADLKTFLVSFACCNRATESPLGPRAASPRRLRYGEHFHLMCAYGYLCGNIREGRDSDRLAISPTPPALPWRFVPCRTTFSPSFFPGECQAHDPSPFTLAGISCRTTGCEAGGTRVYFSASDCQDDGVVDEKKSDESPYGGVKAQQRHH